MTGRVQRCQDCCFLHVGGTAIWCTERGEPVGRAVAGSPNRCHSFAYTLEGAFGGSREGSGGKREKKGQGQCDGQMEMPFDIL